MGSVKWARRASVWGLLVAMAAPAFAATPAAAAPVVDQAQVDSSGGAHLLTPGVSLAQTFTAGMSGRLEGVDVHLRRVDDPGDLRVEIRDVSGGAPGSAVLASATLPAASVGSDFEWMPVALDAPSAAGERYALVLSLGPGGSGSYQWSVSPRSLGDLYPGGDQYRLASDGTWLGPLGSPDFTFRTYVGAAVPQTKEDCKQDAWRTWVEYANQGRCVSTVVRAEP